MLLLMVKHKVGMTGLGCCQHRIVELPTWEWELECGYQLGLCSMRLGNSEQLPAG